MSLVLAELGLTGVKAPYTGLRPFHAEESVIFFGREHQVIQLLGQLEASRFTAVIGSSGCGKSSLVQAGLIPALESGVMVKAGARWRFASMRPEARPMWNLARALIEGLRSSRAHGDAKRDLTDKATRLAFLHATLQRGPLGVVEAVRELGWPPPKLDGDRENLLILVDQFEEIFRYRDEGGRDEVDAFVARLLQAVAQEELPIYLVITMRSDFLGHCAPLKGLTEAINRSQYLTPGLTREQCRGAIELPARLFGGEIEPALVNRLLNDLGDDLDQLPILQHALSRLWTVASADGSMPVCINLPHYERIGKLKEALSVHAEEIYASLDDRQERIAEILFRSLVTTVDSHHIRRPVRLARVAEIAKVTTAEVIPVVDAFRDEGRCFLMPRRAVELTDSSVIDIAHESLIRQWDRLNAWAEQKAQAEKVSRFVAESAALWDSKGRDPDLLMRNDAHMAVVLEWWQAEAEDLAPVQREFLDASRRRRDHELFQQRERQFLRRVEDQTLARVQAIREEKPEVFVAFTPPDKRFALKLRTVLEGTNRVIWSDWDQFPSLDDSADLILKAIESADVLMVVLSPDSAGSSLVRAALRHAQATQKRIVPVVAKELGETPVPAELRSLNWVYFGTGLSFDRAAQVVCDVIDSDLYWMRMHSRLLVQATDWDHHGRGKGLLLRGQDLDEAERWLAQDSPDRQPQSTLLQRQFVQESLREGYQSRRRLWQVRMVCAAAAVLLVSGVVIKRQVDLRHLAEDRNRSETALRLAAQAQALLDTHPVRALLAAVEATAMIGDDKGYATAIEGSLRNALSVCDGWGLSGTGEPLIAAGIHPKNSTVAACDKAGNLLLWDFSKPSPGNDYRPVIHANLLGAVNRLAFSPDGRWLVTTQAGGVHRTENTARYAAATLDGDTARIREVVRLWRWGPDGIDSKNTVELTGDGRPITNFEMSPDGRWLVVLSYPEVGHLYDLHKANPADRPVLLHRASSQLAQRVLAVAFDGNSHRLATTGHQGALVVWALDGAEPKVIDNLRLRPSAQTSVVALTTDDRLVVADRGTSSIRLWARSAGPAAQWRQTRQFPGHVGTVTAALVTRDGRLVTSGQDRTVRIFDLTHYQTPIVLSDHNGPVTRMAISADLRWLFTAGLDRLINRYSFKEIGQSSEPTKIWGAEGPITSLEVDPHGRWLVMVSDGGTGRFVDLMNASYAEPFALRVDDAVININTIAVAPDGRWLVALGANAKLALWDLQSPTGAPSSQFLQKVEEKDVITGAALGRGGRRLAFSTERGGLGVVDLHEAKAPASSNELTPNDAHSLGVVDLHEAKAPEWLKRPATEIDDSPFVDIILSDDGRWVAARDLFGHAWLWGRDERDPGRVQVMLNDGERAISAFALDEQGQRLAIGDVHGKLWLWDPVRHREIVHLDNAFTGPVTAIAFGAGDTRLVAASNRTVKLWDLGSDTNLAAMPPKVIDSPFGGRITATVLSTDGRHLAGAGEDNVVRLWALDNQSPRAVVLSGHQGPVPSLAFDGDQRLVTLSLDGTARLWTLPMPKLRYLAQAKSGRNLTRAEWKLFFGEKTPYQRLFSDLPEPVESNDQPETSGDNWELRARYLKLPIQAF